MKLVIFDLDGVIVSTDKYHYLAWKKISTNNGMEFDEKLNNELRGVSRVESLKIILNFNNKVIDDVKFNELLEEKNDIYKTSLSSLSEKDILEGVIPLIKSLKDNGIKIAIGSSSKNAKTILKQVKLIDEFDAIVDGNDIKNSKPDPEVFIKCCKKLSISNLDSYVFEDAEAGVEAGLKGNMKTIGVGKEKLKKAHIHFESLNNITYDTLKNLKI